MLTKKDVFSLFNGKVSRLAITRGDECTVIGKNTLVQFFWENHEPPLIDIYIRKANGNRINRFMELMQQYELENHHIWDGEAMVQTFDPNAVTDNLRFLRIRKKRKINPNAPPPAFLKQALLR